MKKMFLLLTVLTSISSLIRAQAPISWTSADMYQYYMLQLILMMKIQD